jgi:HNH endonuclease
MSGSKPRPVAGRFWTKVQKGPGCWLWLAHKNAQGYGRIWDQNKQRPAPRVAWELANGKPFPDGLISCHTCDNPSCVNPDHIWAGTYSENIRDAVAKGRHVALGCSWRNHCKYGHDYTPSNTLYRHGTTVRLCRICRDADNRARYRARKQLKMNLKRPAPAQEGER